MNRLLILVSILIPNFSISFMILCKTRNWNSCFFANILICFIWLSIQPKSSQISLMINICEKYKFWLNLRYLGNFNSLHLSCSAAIVWIDCKTAINLLFLIISISSIYVFLWYPCSCVIFIFDIMRISDLLFEFFTRNGLSQILVIELIFFLIFASINCYFLRVVVLYVVQRHVVPSV